MKLPIVKAARERSSGQIVFFRGLNWSEQVQDGDLVDSLGLTSEEYPVLSQRRDRVAVEGHEDVTDFYIWNGKLLTVEGGFLCCDGAHIAGVSDGKKQWAVVNTKLCIIPDKLMVDLSNENELKADRMDAMVTARSEGTVLTSKSLTIARSVATATGVKDNFRLTYRSKSSGFPSPVCYVYGTSKTALAECWDGTQWDLDALSQLPGRMLAGIGHGANGSNKQLSVGDIIIPKSASGTRFDLIQSDENGVVAWSTTDDESPTGAHFGTLPDEKQNNASGIYGVVTAITPETVSVTIDGQTEEVEGGIYYYDTSTGYYGCAFAYTITITTYKADHVVNVQDVFSVGDAVVFSGIPYDVLHEQKAVVSSIDNGANTMNFLDGTLSVPIAYYYASSGLSGEAAYAIQYGGSYYKFTLGNNVEAQNVLLLYSDNGENRVVVWDRVNKKSLGEYSAEKLSSVSSITVLTGTAYTVGAITVQRAIPEMDFICESSNRLWGVSNKDKTIYASSLGMPCQLFDYSGVSTDAYAVAVGSEGNFTAICSYGGGVCCWKENKLHKILGSYPAEYYMTEYDFAGVLAGSEKSLVGINEVLYYLGEEGVYAYTGGVPQLISQKFGTRRFSDGVAGSDGSCLLLSMKDDESGNWGLYTYDIQRGIWLKDSNMEVVSFARMDKHTYMLSKTDNALFIINEGTNEQVEWMAEFAPMNEGISGHKGYTKLWLRLNMDPGAWMMVETQQDRGPWKRAWTQECTTGMTIKLPLMLGRCDRFAIRLTGKGGVTIEGMIREYLVGSDVK